MCKKFDWKELNIVKVCMYYGLAEDLDSAWVLCPEHENDGREHSPSCKVYHNPDKDVIICYGGCYQRNGKRLCLDNISLVATLEGLDQEDKEECIEILNILKDIDEWDGEDFKKSSVKIREGSKSSYKPSKSYDNKLDYLYEHSKTIHELHLENKFFVDDYFNQRGINYNKCKDALEKANIEFRHRYAYDSNILILFDKTHNFAIQRKIDDYVKNKTYGKDDVKYINVNPVYYSKLGDGADVIIFESFYDLICLYSHTKNPEKYTWISSNSTSNISLIKRKETELLKNAENIYLLVDNDDSGDGAVDRFKIDFPKANDIRYLLGEYNDVCESIKHKNYINIEEVN